jgi:hypothetical protein
MRFGISTIAAIVSHPTFHAQCNTDSLASLFPKTPAAHLRDCLVNIHKRRDLLRRAGILAPVLEFQLLIAMCAPLRGEARKAGYTAFSAILPAMENRSFSDVGGTAGGLGHFVLGFIMTCIGGYLFVNQVTVVGSYWNFWGGNSFGITLLPMLFGIGLLFWRGRSILGWILTISGALFIFAGILANLHIFFQPLSLFNTIVILVLLVGGLGLIARSVQSHPSQSGQ